MLSQLQHNGWGRGAKVERSKGAGCRVAGWWRAGKDRIGGKTRSYVRIRT